MSPNKTSPAIAALVEALTMRDAGAFAAAFVEGTIVSGASAHLPGGIREWANSFFDSCDVIRLINVDYSEDDVTLTLVARGTDRTSLEQIDCVVTMGDGKPSSLSVRPSDRPAMPRPVESFVWAVNSSDIERLASTFASEGIVNDQFREYRGRDEIREWARREIVESHVTMFVTGAMQREEVVIVTARVDGTYEKRGLPDPLVLSFYFSTHRDEIVLLIILRNDPDTRTGGSAE
jgi:hypothetical protein